MMDEELKKQKPDHHNWARIHSIETCGTVDGPGLRYIVFTQGCHLRCLYCHNPDTWNCHTGKVQTSEEIFKDILNYKAFIKSSKGGVTVTGGEPLLWPHFIYDLFKRCQEAGIHTALDTAGSASFSFFKKIASVTDLVLLDLKTLDHDLHHKLTKVKLAPILEFAEYLKRGKKPLWVRHVIVPGYTDTEESWEKLAKYLKEFPQLERLDLLPFHQMARYKWEELGYDYALKETPTPTPETLKQANDYFKEQGFPVIINKLA